MRCIIIINYYEVGAMCWRTCPCDSIICLTLFHDHVCYAQNYAGIIDTNCKPRQYSVDSYACAIVSQYVAMYIYIATYCETIAHA